MTIAVNLKNWLMRNNVFVDLESGALGQLRQSVEQSDKYARQVLGATKEMIEQEMRVTQITALTILVIAAILVAALLTMTVALLFSQLIERSVLIPVFVRPMI